MKFCEDLSDVYSSFEAYFMPVRKNLTKTVRFTNKANTSVQMLMLYFKFLMPTEDGYRKTGYKQYDVKQGMQVHL